MFCRNCGKELIGSPEICPNCGARPMSGTGFCPSCGAPTTPLTEICPKCGARVAGKAEVAGGRTWKPTVAGILDIVAGAFGVIYGGVFAAVATEEAFFGIPAAVLIILGIVAIVGGIYNLKRRVWGLSLAGSICALCAPVLGILAIIFTCMGKREFE
jgi:hypothetical protein